MVFFAVFGLISLVTGSLLYLLVCVDPNSQGILGKLNRFVFEFMPSLIKKIVGERIFNILSRAQNYFFYSNHPIVQIFYILVAVGGYILYVYYGFMQLFQNNPLVDNTNTMIGSFLAFISFHSFYQACHFRPGVITKQNGTLYYNQYKEYVDSVIYLKENECKTCNIIKPARSKHCRVCNICVSRFDHHCVWIKQCVGQKNYKYFIKFIGLHALLCNYGAFIGSRCLYGIVLKERLFEAVFRDPFNGTRMQADVFIISRYMFYQYTIFVFIVLLCIIMGLSLTFFLFYHFNMIRFDTTTNERMKRSDFKSFFEDEVKKFDLISNTSEDKEELKQAKSNGQKAKMILDKLQKDRHIGLWKGLKQIFSEPDEVDVKKKKVQ
ncbi:hypothetical protein pb186bvf_012979 [Paramecium bursaria]